jgi:hypothetical protein
MLRPVLQALALNIDLIASHFPLCWKIKKSYNNIPTLRRLSMWTPFTYSSANASRRVMQQPQKQESFGITITRTFKQSTRAIREDKMPATGIFYQISPANGDLNLPNSQYKSFLTHPQAYASTSPGHTHTPAYARLCIPRPYQARYLGHVRGRLL